MAKTVIGLFDTRTEAETAVQELRDNGVDSGVISVVANNGGDATATTESETTESEAADGAATGAVSGTVLGGALGLLVGAGLLAIPGIGPVLAAGPLAAAIGTTAAAVGAGALGAGLGAATGGLLGGLLGAGVPEEDAHVYAEGVRRGGTLVTVDADDAQADLVVSILERHNPVDVDTRRTQYRESGWDRFNPDAERYSSDVGAASNVTPPTTTPSAPVRATTTATTDAERVLPVVEEELQVGKREVQRGGVRVHTRVVEVPIEEQVTLREEHVEVERRPVDRPVTDADQALLKDQVIEVRTTAEEAVVSKEARVVEEVVVEKEVAERTETVRDTVRRTDVDVDQLGSRAEVVGYETYDADFRNHYQANYAGGSQAYTYYEPIYRYGYGLHSNTRYSNQEWSAIEADVRQDWERQHTDSPWEQVKDTVRYAWEKARGRRA